MELAYRTTIALGRTAMRAVDLRVRLDDAHHVPRTGPAILVANHVSFLGFLLVGLAARPAGRYPRFLTRHEVWRNPVAGPFMTAMRHVPVDRAAPAAAYLRARALLRDGETVAAGEHPRRSAVRRPGRRRPVRGHPGPRRRAPGPARRPPATA